ncbi:hypothetical protein [Cohnella herbarum]|uniref:Uncharacterized protein n=1 Tax=Cohnella herbarum TaxID=2728023 RepID=A0A7Z2VR19_9BACL|nr:hypothetical protein [Cohnella herbarum]QJD87903.1 hypothetical protein HH215_35075 [Cohnella herbarum]
MYAWASPDYMLDHMSFEQIVMYYDYGLEQEEIKSNILVGRLAVGLFGAKEKPKAKVTEEKPDRKAFQNAYGNRIKRPEGGAT